MIRFPDGFGWGTATASYQIEGAVSEDGRSPSIWDTFSHTPGKIADGTNGDRAADHYHRWAEDVELMAGLNVGFYRFSLAWPRLQPDGRGELNQKGVSFYARLADALRERGIEPWITLYHWDLPQVLEDLGGWPERDTALRFADYAEKVHAALGGTVRYWTTLNEPYCSGILGYAAGVHAPGRKEPAAAIRAVHHLLLGHGLAVQAMRAGNAEGHEFGITLNLTPAIPASDSEADADAARRVDLINNRLFLDPVLRGAEPEDLRAGFEPILGEFDHVHEGDLEVTGQPLDALGINYYFRLPVRAGTGERFSPDRLVGASDVEVVSRDLPRSDMGWEIDPEGLHAIITRVWDEYSPPPLWVTENGVAWPDVVAEDGGVHDERRIAYLDAHFRAAHRAIQDGVDLRGYFVWTLIDNFEWAYGESKRFGLVHVDYETQARTPKDSSRWYAQVAARNGLDDGEEAAA